MGNNRIGMDDMNSSLASEEKMDIVERLRALSRCDHDDLSIGDEAADEIQRLRFSPPPTGEGAGECICPKCGLRHGVTLPFDNPF